MGLVELVVEFGNRDTRDVKAIKALFNVVDLPLTYNSIIGRPILYEIDVTTSIRWLTMKISLEDWVITILRDQIMTK